MNRWLVAAALLLAVPAALAHAEPFQSDPARGARLESAPDLVWVDFTEPIFTDGSWIRVFDQDGRRVDNGDLTITGPTERPRMQVTLTDLPDGAYSIRWQTYSRSDGHTITGTIGFAVGGFAPPASTEDPESRWDVVPALARAVLYAGIALGIGAIAYAAAVLRSVLWDERRPLMVGAGLALVGTLLLTWDTWRGTGLDAAAYLTSDGGRPFVWRILVAAALTGFTIAWAQWPRLGRAPVVAGWIVLTWLTASFGHITREGSWAIVLEWVHLVAAAVWIGGLWLFLRTLHTDPVPLGRRFGRMAQWAVLVLVVSGSVISAILVGRIARDDPARFWDDSWAWFLAAKVGLVLVMLLLAGTNRFLFVEEGGRLARWVTAWRPDWTATGEAKRRNLRRVTTVEAGVSLFVVVAAGFLLSVSPPAEAFDVEAPGLERTAQGDEFLALMQVSPAPAAGQGHTFRFFVQTPDGQPVTDSTCGRDDCLRMRWLVDDDEASEQVLPLAPEGDGWWRAAEVLLTQPGSTQVTLSVQTAYVFREDLVFRPFSVA